jgi:hypothetical protein
MKINVDKRIWRGMSCWSKITCGSPIISKILSSTSIKTLWQVCTLTSSKDVRIGAYSITSVNSDVQTGPKVINIFKHVIYGVHTKLERFKNRLKKLVMDKHFSLLQQFVTYRQKKFYNIGPGK